MQYIPNGIINLISDIKIFLLQLQPNDNDDTVFISSKNTDILYYYFYNNFNNPKDYKIL